MDQISKEPRFGVGSGLVALGAGLGLMILFLWLLGWRVAAYPTPLTDLGSYFLPKYQYAADRIAAGELPLWNPYEFGGIPFLATLQPAVFYPPIRVAYAWLSGEGAYTAAFFIHLLIGATASLALMRHLGVRLWPAVLASLWVVQPTWIMRVWDHPVYIWAVAWIPLLLLLLHSLLKKPEVRTAGLLAAVAAMQVLSGYPPMILATAYLLVLAVPFFLLERRMHGGTGTIARAGTLLLAAAGVTVLLTAAQILPAAELARMTNRTQEAAEAARFVDDIAREVPRLGFFIGIPSLGAAEAASAAWEVYGPVLFALVLAALFLGWRSPFVWFGAAGMTLATFLPLEAYRSLPFYGIVRFALEWGFIAPMLVYLLAGLGLHALLERSGLRARSGGLVAALLIGLTMLWNWQMIDPGWKRAQIDQDLMIPEWIADDCELVDQGYRAFWPLGQLRGSLMASRIRSIGGYEQSLIPARNAEVSRKLGIGNGGYSTVSGKAVASNRWATSRLSLRCLLVGRSPELVAAGFEETSRADSRLVAYRDPKALPRARLAFAVRFAATPAEALAALFAPESSGVTLEAEPTALPSCSRMDEASVSVVEDAPERVAISVDSPCPAYLVLADTWMPDWTATLDGESVEVRRAEYTMRAVRVPSGRHQVVFQYGGGRTVYFGMALSALGLLIAAVMVTRSPRD